MHALHLIVLFFTVKACSSTNANSTTGSFKIYPRMKSLAIPFETLIASKELVCIMTCNASPGCFALDAVKDEAGFICNMFDGMAASKPMLYQQNGGNYYEKEYFKDCADVLAKGNKQSGIYAIVLPTNKKLKIFCDMTTRGGGWTLFQRQTDKGFDFNMTMPSYKAGFGDPLSDFWLGLDSLHTLTLHGDYTLRFDLWCRGFRRRAEYKNFRVDNEINGYRVTFGAYVGNAGDSFVRHYGMKFTTTDVDVDLHETANCAVANGGGFWFHNCHPVALNVNMVSETDCDWDGPIWHKSCGACSLTRTEMKLRKE